MTKPLRRPTASLLDRLHQILVLKHSQTRFVVLQILKRCWMKQQFARLKLKQLSEVICECSLYKQSVRQAFDAVRRSSILQATSKFKP